MAPRLRLLPLLHEKRRHEFKSNIFNFPPEVEFLKHHGQDVESRRGLRWGRLGGEGACVFLLVK
jgi:hypothetical protein